MSPAIDASYVLPIKWSEDGDRAELTAYLRRVAGWIDEVIVVDGSEPAAFSANSAAWGSFVKHIAPDADLAFKNGKVDGVTTGLRTATHERVVIADDDVRYDEPGLRRVVELLNDAELVRPQNFFTQPMPWHAAWDTARSLINRATGADYPGTLGLRRSLFMKMGGYDGDVMFENLELIRTVEAAGGREVAPLDLYVARIPPSASRFLSQRVRQAYDEFALPGRMALWLSVVPFTAWALRTGRAGAGAGVAAAIVTSAEVGRRRAGGRQVFPARASLMAPLWVLERGVCVWAALGSRARGGVRYGGTRIARAARSRPRENLGRPI